MTDLTPGTEACQALPVHTSSPALVQTEQDIHTQREYMKMTVIESEFITLLHQRTAEGEGWK